MERIFLYGRSNLIVVNSFLGPSLLLVRLATLACRTGRWRGSPLAIGEQLSRQRRADPTYTNANEKRSYCRKIEKSK